MWEVTGIRIPLFDLSERPEEVLYDALAGSFGLVCVRGVVYGTVAVLELPIAGLGW